MEEIITLTRVELKDKSVLANMFQLYMHDITAVLPRDLNSHGFFNYEYIDSYFTSGEGKIAYFSLINDKFAGFVMISDDFMVLTDEEKKYNMSEFFILNTYKNKGYGEIIANRIFDMYKGYWEVRPVPRSEGAKRFWERVIKKYTNNNYKESFPKPNRCVFTFYNGEDK